MLKFPLALTKTLKGSAWTKMVEGYETRIKVHPKSVFDFSFSLIV